MSDDMRKIIRETVNETLSALGIDHKNPEQTQRDFAFLHDFRTEWTATKRHIRVVLMGLIITSAAGLMWSGFAATIAASASQ